MKTKKLLLVRLWLVVAIALGLFAALPAAAQDDAEPPMVCSLATLQGTYGVFVEGTMVVLPIPAPLTPPVHFVITGTATFDGNGNVSTFAMQTFGGLIIPWAAGTGTYKVNPDCTMSSDFPHFGTVSHRFGVITGQGMQQEIHLMFGDIWWVASSTVKKVPVGSCSLATLNGTYGLFGNGTMPPMATPALLSKVGILTFDGAGNFAGRDTTNTRGTVVPDAPFTGSYTVDADCRASVTFQTSAGEINEQGVITGQGAFKEFRGMFTNAGWAFAQTLKQQ